MAYCDVDGVFDPYLVYQNENLSVGVLMSLKKEQLVEVVKDMFGVEDLGTKRDLVDRIADQLDIPYIP